MMQHVTVEQLKGMHERGEPFDLLDVRTPAEFRSAHIAFARNVPLETLDPGIALRDRRDPSAPLICVCRTGRRARQAAERFARCGVETLMVLEATDNEWEAGGLPVVHGKKMISLERQTRMVIGSLVVIGALLAFFVHPAFAWFGAAVGAGLLVAGITDSCAVAMLLARAPWNQTVACAHRDPPVAGEGRLRADRGGAIESAPRRPVRSGSAPHVPAGGASDAYFQEETM